MITKVKLMGVCVKDQAQALDFYVNKLGFKLVTNMAMSPGARWIEVVPPGAATRLALWTPPGLEDRIGTFSQIVFTCDDVRGTYAELRERGVTFTQEPEEQSWGISAVFVDPDGNSFVLNSQA